MTHRFFLSLAIGMTVALSACSGGTKDDAPKKEGPPPPPPPETVSSRPNAGPGEKLFLAKCAMCHGPGGMGTGLLARRVDEGLLEKRTDMTPDFVTQAARMGIGYMPAIPRGEVSDAEMKQIADYLGKSKEGAE